MVHLILMKLIKRIIHFLKNNLKILSLYTLKTQFIRLINFHQKQLLYHHQGLGDIIIVMD